MHQKGDIWWRESRTWDRHLDVLEQGFRLQSGARGTGWHLPLRQVHALIVVPSCAVEFDLLSQALQKVAHHHTREGLVSAYDHVEWLHLPKTRKHEN